MIQLSIVIVNYNTAEITTNCIRSIYEHTKDLDFEIILVDNGSTENVDYSFKKSFPQIRFVQLHKNEGFARGNNAGINLAEAQHILLINSDTLVFDNSIKRTYDFLTQTPDIGLVGCKLLNEDGSEQLSSFIPVKFPMFNLLVNTNVVLSKILKKIPSLKLYACHLEVVKEYQKTSHYCEGVSGAFMMFKKKKITQCGYLDPDFFLYCEEVEWCRNRILKQTRIYYYCDASVVHLGGRSAPGKIASKQTLLSSFLYSYKLGLSYYYGSIIIHAINAFCNLPVLVFMNRTNSLSTLSQIISFWSLIPDLIFNIPRYSKRFGSRPAPLMIKEMRR